MSDSPILPEASLRRALRVQMDVLGALILRELHTRFGRENLGYLWLFLEPMILAGCVAVIHQLSGHGLPGGMMPFPFYIISYTPHYLLRAILTRAPTALEANLPLFFHARVRLHDVLVARTLLELAAVMIAMIAFLTGLGILTNVWPEDPVMVAMGLVMTAVLMHGLGLLVCAATAFGHATVERVIHPATYLMLPLSGAFFMLWWLPEGARQVLWWIPTVHIYEFIREAYFGPMVPYHYDLGYLGIWMLLSNVLGLLALRVARPHMEA